MGTTIPSNQISFFVVAAHRRGKSYGFEHFLKHRYAIFLQFIIIIVVFVVVVVIGRSRFIIIIIRSTNSLWASSCRRRIGGCCFSFLVLVRIIIGSSSSSRTTTTTTTTRSSSSSTFVFFRCFFGCCFFCCCFSFFSFGRIVFGQTRKIRILGNLFQFVLELFVCKFSSECPVVEFFHDATSPSGQFKHTVFSGGGPHDTKSFLF
mmetsp:Transcript_21122/g.31899  ORF Transcript_21122/g.31899 Transcript_21122/m.31899 type:complete len:205 (-) Transcript_21122:1301-1915(-)